MDALRSDTVEEAKLAEKLEKKYCQQSEENEEKADSFIPTLSSTPQKQDIKG